MNDFKTGVVFHYNAQKRLGFIKPDGGGAQIWFNFGDGRGLAGTFGIKFLSSPTRMPEPKSGDRVVYHVGENYKGPKARPWGYFDEFVRVVSSTVQLGEHVVVQYCPCGHTDVLTIGEILESGAVKQLVKIANGQKLDAVTLHSNDCRTCQEDRASQERLYRAYAIDDSSAPLTEGAVLRRSRDDHRRRNMTFRQGRAVQPQRASRKRDRDRADPQQAAQILAKHMAWKNGGPCSKYNDDACELVAACDGSAQALQDLLNMHGLTALTVQKRKWANLADEYEVLLSHPPSEARAAFDRSLRLEKEFKFSDAARAMAFAIAVANKAFKAIGGV